jgi:hypothetical protein
MGHNLVRDLLGILPDIHHGFHEVGLHDLSSRLYHDNHHDHSYPEHWFASERPA